MSKKVIIIVSTVIMVLIGCLDAHAIRPLSTEDAGMVDPGKLEGEFGFEYTREKNEEDRYRFTVVPIYGLTENITICSEIPLDIIRPKEGSGEEGFSDMGLAVKVLMYEETENVPQFAFKTFVKMRTGDENKGLGSGDENVGMLIAATKSIGDLTLHGNLGYTFVGKDHDDSLKDTILYGIGFEYALNETFSILSEVFGESEEEFNEDSHAVNPLIGFRYKLNDMAVIDTAFKAGVSHKEKTNYSVVNGISVFF